MWLGSGIVMAVVQTSAAASILPLAQELPYAVKSGHLEKKKKKKKKKIANQSRAASSTL